MIHWTKRQCALGTLLMVADQQKLCGLYLEGQKYQPDVKESWQHSPELALFERTCEQLGEYLDNRRRHFDLPLAPQGTPFQQQVWSALQQIPYGETRQYGQLARTLGKASATRAVAAAIGRNPLLIVIPCHRVVGANGSLTGFAAGVERKAQLLKLEGTLG